MMRARGSGRVVGGRIEARAQREPRSRRSRRAAQAALAAVLLASGAAGARAQQPAPGEPTAAAAVARQPAGAPSAPSTSSIEDVLQILRREGMIDEAEEAKVLAKYTVERKAAGAPAWLAGSEFSGDFRVRYEGFFFSDDARGIDAVNRNRFRYRARFGFTKTLGERVKIGLRLASGAGDARSTNTSFGEGNSDGFAPDSIFFDRAFLELKLQDSDLMQTRLAVGKLPNPFIGRSGTDSLLFDSDINMEGLFVSSSLQLDETTRVYGTLGGFIVDEVAGAKDPKLAGAQLGFETQLGGRTALGLRASAYQFRSLDENFLASAAMFGNLPSAFDGRARLGETFAYLNYDLAANWPLLVFASAVKNFSADSARLPVLAGDPALPTTSGFVDVGDEDMAFSGGFEIGSATRFARLGASLFRVEANAVIAQFYDTDPLDGFTNRAGLALFASRKLNANTELRLSLFDSDRLRSSGGPGGPFRISLINADRRLARLDLLFAF
jgi:hypothetical protein